MRGVAWGALCLLTLAACTKVTAARGTFVIELDEPVTVAVRALPSPNGGGDNFGGGNAGEENASAPAGGGNGVSAGGGSGGGGSGGGVAAPAPGAGLSIDTEGRFDLTSVAGDLAGTTFRQVNGVTVGPDGTVYAADPLTNQIRAVPAGGGAVTTVAGLPDGLAGFFGDNLPATGSRLSEPVGMAFDAHTGVLVFADAGNKRIREFAPGGRLYTHAGGGADAGDNVASATVAQLGRPTGVALDDAGDVFFTERDTGRVRRVAGTGALTTLLTLAAVGPIASNPAGTLLWVGAGSTVRAIKPGPPVAVAPVVDFPGSVVVGLAPDQAGTLYVALSGPKSGQVKRLLVDGDGQLVTGRQPEAVGGTGADVGASTAAFVAAPNPDARTQLIAGGGECSLAIDLAHANDPAVLAGMLYAGNSGTGWGQLLKLGPVGP